MKSNIHKKLTFEDKFDRKYACWVKNNPKAWRFWKRRNRKLFRKKMREDVFIRKVELNKKESEWLIDYLLTNKDNGQDIGE